MDHKYIDELDIIERYLMGRVGVDETAKFEEHFVDCSECVDRLRTTKALMEGLRIVATDAKPEAARIGRQSVFGYLRHRASRPSFALAGIVFLTLLLGIAVLSNQIWRSRIEAARAKNTSAEWERRYEEEHQSHSLSDTRHQASERELTSQVVQLQAELENNRKQELGKTANRYPGPERPQINFATFELTSTQRGNPEPGSITTLPLPRTPTRFMISIALEGDTRYADYRMTIRRGQNQRIWRRSGFKPNQYDSLSAVFNSTFFSEGDYILVLEGISAHGITSLVGEYTFRVQKTQ